MRDIIADCPEAGTPEYEQYLKDAAAALATLVKPQVPKQLDRILVISNAQERDFLSVPFSETFDDPNSHVFTASFWNKVRSGSPSSTPTNNVLAYHADDFPAEVDLIVSITLSASEPASIADNFFRIAGRIKADGYIVLTVASSQEERNLLIEEIGYRTTLRPEVITLEDDLSLETLSKSARLLVNHRDHLVFAYGSKSQSYMPMSLGGPAPNFPTDLALRNKFPGPAS